MMASSYEARQVAIKIKNIYNQIDNRRSKMLSSAKEASFWWSGKASDSFNLEYKKINDEVNTLLDLLAMLERQLKTIAFEIENWEALLLEE